MGLKKRSLPFTELTQLSITRAYIYNSMMKRKSISLQNFYMEITPMWLVDTVGQSGMT